MSSKLFKAASITKKVTMALAGVFLILFLLVHLGINLTLLRNDDGAWFSAASNFMSTNYIVKVFEIILIAAFLIHILIGIMLTIQNWLARPKRYYRRNKSKTSFMSKYMFYTGGIVLIFLFLHFMSFYFVKLGIVTPPEGIDRHDFYTMAILLFSNKLYSILYIVALIVLAIHLNHSFHSAFQTFGFNHNKYYTLIKGIGTAYAVIVVAGFIIIPVYFMFFYQ
ncbi:MAG: succinate dehydrogenase cytochrome b subunit [Bacteroidales bacterium]|nr:succinate dehydrogenase cytochrome b subunit [Bacteroidales bacterium]